MTFTDSIWIDAPSHKIWRFVSSLDVWPLLLAKKGKCRSRQQTPVSGVLGAISRIELEIGRESAWTRWDMEIVEIYPESMITVKMTMDGEDRGMNQRWASQAASELQVTYVLKDEGFRTKVIEEVELTSALDGRINLVVKGIGWLIYRFRKLAGRTNLQRLKGIAEGTGRVRVDS
jgi:hypothetical protein